MTAERPTPEGGLTHTSLPLFLVTLARKQEAPEIFKLTVLSNIVIKVKACRSQNGLIRCYTCQCFAHIWVHCRQRPRCLWCGGGHCHRTQRNRMQRVSRPAATATCKTGNRCTQQITMAAIMQNRNYSEERTCGRQHRGRQGGRSSRNTHYLIDHLPLLFAAPNSSIHHNKNRKSSGKNTRQNTNQISGQTVQAKNVNISVTDDVSLALTTVQQI